MQRGKVQVFTSRQEWALFFVTMVWGGTFLLIRLAMQESGPFFFVGLRFFFAGILLLAVSWSLWKEISRREIWAGILLGIVVAMGFGLQTAGLVTITAAKSAFLTAFYIPLVPLFEVVFLRHRLERRIVLGLLLSFPGVLCIAWPHDASLGLGLGEVQTIVCAIVFAWEIILVGLVAPSCNARRLVVVELFVASILCFAAMPFFGEHLRPVPTWVLGICLLLGGISAGMQSILTWVLGICLLLGGISAGMQSILTWAQKSVDPSRATLIYAGEPVWAGIFGFLAGESIDSLACIGCVLVVLGVVVSRRKTSSPTEAGEEE